MKRILFFELAIVFASAFVGFVWGRVSAPSEKREEPPKASRAWSPLPNAVTFGWSQNDPEVLQVYFAGQFQRDLRELEDGREFRRLKELYEEIAAEGKTRPTP